MFTHKIWTGVSGNGWLTSSAQIMTSPWAKAVGKKKLIVFWRLSRILRPSLTALAIVWKLSSPSTMSAACLLTSLPLIPIAIPTSARFKAGASFTPSPVIPTISSFFWRASTIRNLCSGVVRANTSTDFTCFASSSSDKRSMSIPSNTFFVCLRPICSAIACAVSLWSPVIIFTEIPAFWHSLTARIALSFGGSIIPAIPTKVSSFNWSCPNSWSGASVL